MGRGMICISFTVGEGICGIDYYNKNYLLIFKHPCLAEKNTAIL